MSSQRPVSERTWALRSSLISYAGSRALSLPPPYCDNCTGAQIQWRRDQGKSCLEDLAASIADSRTWKNMSKTLGNLVCRYCGNKPFRYGYHGRVGIYQGKMRKLNVPAAISQVYTRAAKVAGNWRKLLDLGRVPSQFRLCTMWRPL